MLTTTCSQRKPLVINLDESAANTYSMILFMADEIIGSSLFERQPTTPQRVAPHSKPRGDLLLLV
jgi:hypothetical protein